MKFNITYATSAQSAPAGFATAVQAACDYWGSVLTDNVTVNLTFAWGSAGGGLAQTNFSFYTYSYAAVTQALRANVATPDQQTAVNALPGTSPFSNSNVAVTTAQARMLGLTSYSGSDATITLGSNFAWTFDPNQRAKSGAYDAIGALEHEISEALGRFAGFNTSLGANGTPAILNFYRRTSAGAIDTGYANSGDWFSLDGVNKLISMGESGSDWADWGSSVTGDSFGYGAQGVAGYVTGVDLQAMSACGWRVGSSSTTYISASGTYNLSSASIQVNSSVTNVTINGSYNAIAVSDNDSVAVIGGANSVKVAAGSTLKVGANGAWGTTNAIAAASAQITVLDSSHADLTGSSNTVTLLAGSNLGVIGAGNIITAAGADGIWLSGNGANGVSNQLSANNSYVSVGGSSHADLKGWKLSVSLGAGSNLGVTGAANSITSASGSNIWIGGNGASGDANAVNGNGLNAYLGANSRTNCIGSYNKVTADLGSVFSVIGGANSVYGATGDSIWLGGNGAWGLSNGVIGSGMTVYLDATAHMDVYGDSNVVGAGAGSNLGVYGSGDLITVGAGDGVWVGGGAGSAGKNVVVGDKAFVHAASNSATGVSGSFNECSVGDGAAFEFYGTGNVVRAGSADTITLWGGANNLIAAGANNVIHAHGTLGTTVMVGPNVGAMTIDGFSSTSIIDLVGGVGGMTSFAQIAANLASDGAGGSKLTLGANGSIDFVGVAASSLTAANFKFG